jgi:hypothetical protein
VSAERSASSHAPTYTTRTLTRAPLPSPPPPAYEKTEDLVSQLGTRRGRREINKHGAFQNVEFTYLTHVFRARTVSGALVQEVGAGRGGWGWGWGRRLG